MSQTIEVPTSTNYAKPHRPMPVYLFNLIGGVLEHAGINGKIDATAILGRARSRTGLTDFGGAFAIEAFGVLIHSINREAQLTPLGRLIQRTRLLDSMIARLQMVDFLRSNPQISVTPLNKVMLIAGLQRTGTTLLQRLLASHPMVRGVTAIEAFDPVGSLRDIKIGSRSARRRASMHVKALSYLAPDFKTIHPVDESEPEEDVMLLDLSFMSQAPEAMMHVPSYANWLEQQDHRPVYGEFKKTLQLLQSNQPQKHWVLKSPHHMEYLDVVLECFPDATIIETHRDPRKTMPSFCSMVAHSHGIFSDRVNATQIANHWVRKVKRMMRKSIEVRTKNQENFHDISYYDLTERPLDTLASLYERVGIEFDVEARVEAQKCLDRNPQNKFGKHRYQLSDFDLDDARAEEEFGFYRTHYQIPVES